MHYLADGAYISLTVAWRIDDSYEQRRPLYFDILIRPLCNQTTDNGMVLTEHLLIRVRASCESMV